MRFLSILAFTDAMKTQNGDEEDERQCKIM